MAVVKDFGIRPNRAAIVFPPYLVILPGDLLEPEADLRSRFDGDVKC